MVRIRLPPAVSHANLSLSTPAGRVRFFDTARLHAVTSTGYRGLQPPFDAFWRARCAIVEDPDGIAIGLMSPIDPTRRTAPPKDWIG